MPEQRADTVERTPEERIVDHEAIRTLADGLLPALVAKLSSSGLGEIEVREGRWRVRLRRPAGGPPAGRRATDRIGRSQAAHDAHGHALLATDAHRVRHSSNGTDPGEPIGADRQPGRGPDDRRFVATSPAVGLFRPGLGPGAKVRSGDRVASVDMLGVAHDVLAPVDGIVGSTLAEPGDAVEYGEPLVVVELAESERASTVAD
ncbi:MAG: acetyl-CoA carboxylase biotin carboxyl carrier protein [Chloroflexota bacterium]